MTLMRIDSFVWIVDLIQMKHIDKRRQRTEALLQATHSITIHMFDDMVETVEFKCGGKAIRTIVGDGNIQGQCVCGRDFTTVGDYTNKTIQVLNE